MNGPVLTEDITGKKNSAYQFDGSDDYIKVEHSSTLHFKDDFTLSAWLKYPSQVGGKTDYGAIFVKGEDSKGWNGITFFVDNPGRNGASFIARNERGKSIFVQDLPIDTNEWQHLVFLKRKNSLKFYLNGGQVIQEQPIKPIHVFCERELWIGCNNLNTRNQNYEGVMDELRMYDRALSNDEVRALYEIYRAK